MPSLRTLYPTLRLAVACLLLAIGLRTWVVMGLIDPVTVSGSSMVPTLRGTFVAPKCPACDHEFSVGAEFAVGVERMTCPSCENAEVSLDGLALQRGDRLWVDRLSLRWRKPKRWETVVARNPHNGAELCVKRVVGLPGDQVDLRDGDVRIDGAVLVKSTDERQLVRQLVHREVPSSRRWQPDEQTSWQTVGSNWQHAGNRTDETAWLRYCHPGGRPITDDVSYNAGLTRRLNNVDEFALALDMQLGGTGSIQFVLDDGTATADVHIALPTGQIELTESGRLSSTLQLATSMVQRVIAQAVPIELTNFDQQLLLVVDDEVVLRRNWPRTTAAGTDRPIAIGVAGLDVKLGNLTLYRDLYHSSHPVGAAGPSAARWLLGAGEYFLLGDNSPVSVDSRLWGPVPARLLIGKPL